MLNLSVIMAVEEENIFENGVEEGYLFSSDLKYFQFLLYFLIFLSSFFHNSCADKLTDDFIKCC